MGRHSGWSRPGHACDLVPRRGDVQRAHLLTPQAGMRDAGCGQPAPSWMRDQKLVSEEGIKLDLFFFF